MLMGGGGGGLVQLQYDWALQKFQFQKFSPSHLAFLFYWYETRSKL